MVYLVVVLAGELAAFIGAAYVIKRPRPFVHHLDAHAPPTSAYPSGHTAATPACTSRSRSGDGLARGWWRWLFLVPAIALPVRRLVPHVPG